MVLDDLGAAVPRHDAIVTRTAALTWTSRDGEKRSPANPAGSPQTDPSSPDHGSRGQSGIPTSRHPVDGSLTGDGGGT